MLANYTDLKALVLAAALNTPPANYDNKDVNAAFHGEFDIYKDNINLFMRDKHDIFQIMIETIDEIVPKRVITTLSAFAEVQQVPQGTKAKFKRRLGRNRAKAFLTQVGVSGVYETFRLDNSVIEVSGHAIGGGARVDFERLLDGAESMSELMTIITDGFEDDVYLEVQKALVAAYADTNAPAANRKTASSFDADKMVALVNTVKAYGENCAIFATPAFISEMGPDAIVSAISGAQGIYDPRDIAAIHDRGRINIFRGTPIVELPNSYLDETNNKVWLNDQYAYVLPTGQEKVVKVVLEGKTQMWDNVNRDQSIEVMAYKRIGVAILTVHNWGIYQNTHVADNSASPYGT